MARSSTPQLMPSPLAHLTRTSSVSVLSLNTHFQLLFQEYVDDIVLAGKSDRKMSELASRFDVKDMGELYHFFGVKILQDWETGNVWIGHPGYAESILQKFGMENAKSVSTPVDIGTKLLKTRRLQKSLYEWIGHY